MAPACRIGPQPRRGRRRAGYRSWDGAPVLTTEGYSAERQKRRPLYPPLPKAYTLESSSFILPNVGSLDVSHGSLSPVLRVGRGAMGSNAYALPFVRVLRPS